MMRLCGYMQHWSEKVVPRTLLKKSISSESARECCYHAVIAAGMNAISDFK